MRHLAIALSLAAFTTASGQDPENWPQFLGPQSMARASGADTLSFDRERDLIYRAALPPGESSPCIWGDQIFLTGYEQDQLGG